MRVIIKSPGEPALVLDLEDYRSFIGGQSAVFPILTADGSRYVIVCNDNFLNDGSKFNISLTGVQFFGNIFICKLDYIDDDLDFCSLSDDDILSLVDCIGWSEPDKASIYCCLSSYPYPF